MATHNGYLVIADITGYTEFTVQSEIEHAEGIISGLMGTIVDALKPPFVISKLEGDAVFSYVPAARFCQDQSLLEMLETVYFRFRDLLFQMRKNSTCPCNACVNMQALDLKVVVHYGEFALSEIAGGQELSGPNVIAVHRLMKNSVSEATGIDAYCFVTDAALGAMGLDGARAGMVSHAEVLEQIGAIEGQVHSLDQAWETYRDRNVVRVDPSTAYLVVSETIPLSQAATWDYMHDDEHWLMWSRSTEEPRIRRPASGRNGVGMEKHCVHGKDNIEHTIVDWRPFDYYTTDLRINRQVDCRQSVTLEAVDGGTRVSFVSEAPKSDKFVPRFVLRLMGKKLRRQIEADIQSCLVTLRQMVEADLASGKINAR